MRANNLKIKRSTLSTKKGKLYSHMLENNAWLVGKSLHTRMYTKLGNTREPNRPFAGSGHMVRNKLHWDANNAVGLSKQRNSYQPSSTFLCFESPTALFPSQCNSFRTMWPDPAKGLFMLTIHVENLNLWFLMWW